MNAKNTSLNSLRTVGRSSSISGKLPRRDRRVRPTLGDGICAAADMLERRLVLSSAHVHATARTAVVGSMGRPLSAGTVSVGHDEYLSATVGKRHPIKYFQFSVDTSEVIHATLSGNTKRTVMSLRESSGQLISIAAGKGSSISVATNLQPGTYVLVVSHTGRGNSNCMLSLGATSPGKTTATNLNQSSGNSTNRGTSVVTIQQFATALDSALKKGLTQFARDATIVEAFAPTAYSSVVGPELAQVDRDVINGSYFQAFAEIRTLGQTLLQEAQYTVYWGLPDSRALLGYSQVVSDLKVVGALKEISYAFLAYVAARLPSHSTGTTPTYWTTGVLGSGSSGGVLSTSNQTLLTGYSSGDLDKW